ncbi:TerC family protein [Tolumonas osonensis]|uniref:Putative tellurium resistance membrane protein TerC n=1 Tax=Tolumonas osonensis TaxID=675874 RepID=A0A841GKR9_9GAMM|nr:TerC family protein [Tolumonas osonensis]MBB6055390.1 putative tellurium resistance membrane protein TerC [Tolumonas osonensis]
MFEWIADPSAWVALATLTLLEIVLGIDNIIFISILVGKLPPEQRQRARVLGLGGAMVTRILLLLSLAWVMRLTAPMFTILEEAISGRDLILIVGGLFLIWKSTHEIHSSLEGSTEEHHESKKAASFLSTLIQIAILDIVFSLDSVITAVGMADHVPVMVLAIVIAVGVMMFAAKPIGDFVDANPTLKILALAFLIMVGMALIAESFDLHISKGYIYTAMAFSLLVEMLNIRMRKGIEKPIHLHKAFEEENS